VSSRAFELADEIRRTGRRSPRDLVSLIEQSEQLATASPDPYTRGISIRAAGSGHQMLSNFTAALERYNAALAAFDAAEDPTQIGRTLLAKIGPLACLGQLDELFECADRARRIFESEDDRASLARLDVNLGNVYSRQDRLLEALECYRRATPTLEDMSDDEALIAASMNAAVVQTTLHRFAEAHASYHRAAQVATRLAMYSLELQCRYNQAYLRYLEGHGGEALDRIRELRTAFDRQGDEQHICLCWLSEAEILLEIGDLPESIRMADRAREQAGRLGLNHEAGKALLFHGIALMRSGDTDSAEVCIEQANAHFSREGNSVWAAMSQLQSCLFPIQNTDDADAISRAESARKVLADRALTHWVALADVVIGRLRQRAGHVQEAIDAFRSAAAAAEAGNATWTEFHACHELGAAIAGADAAAGKAWLLRAESLLDGLWNRIGSDDLKIAFLTDRDNVYTKLVPLVAKSGTAEAFRLSDKARSRVLIERLEMGTGPKVDALSSYLSADESIVEYFVAGDDLFIFVLDRDGVDCIRRSGAITRLREAWGHMERHLRSCSVTWEKLRHLAGQLERTARTHLSELDDELIRPVRQRLRHRVVIVPHGLLHGIPFQALHDGERYLCELHDVVYSANARLYALPAAQPGSEAPLFIGFTPEVDSGIAEEVRNAASSVDGAEVLINPSPGELVAQLSVPRALIHVAGHAGIDPVRGALAWIETPKGRLTGPNLVRMKLCADTIVVTGCNTAHRTLSAGDEWLGLMRAFYLSGARTIVSAHWAIRDQSARLFSETFYRDLDPARPSTAVEAARSAIRKEFPHPYFWAGFGTFARKREGDSL